MDSWVYAVGFFVAWFVLQTWLFPKMGVPT